MTRTYLPAARDDVLLRRKIVRKSVRDNLRERSDRFDGSSPKDDGRQARDGEKCGGPRS